MSTPLIRRVGIVSAAIPLKVPFRIATMVVDHTESVFISITDSEGNHGVGEANPFQAIVGESAGTVFAACEILGTFLLGKPSLAIHDHFRSMAAFLPHNTTARSGFDIALWDLAARKAKMPLYSFLGGEERPLLTDNTIGLFEPEEMARRAALFVSQGFSAVKVKLGTDAETDIRRIALIRGAVGPGVPIRVDANQGWDYPQAVKVLRAIEQYGIEYCEQPLPARRIEQLRQLRSKTTIPIMADESLFDLEDALALVNRQACDMFNIKLSKSAGISGALPIISLAETAGIPCMIGCMSESRIYQSAAAHLAASRKIFHYTDLDGPHMHTFDPVTGGARYEGEMVRPGAGPGHGAQLNRELLPIQKEMVLEA